MTPELWKKVKATLGLLDSLPADCREAELARLRQDDPELAAEVVSLLQQRTTPPTPDEQPARPVGQEEVGAEKTYVPPEGNLGQVIARVLASVPLGNPSADPDSVPPDVPGCQLDGGEENVRYGGMGVVYFGTERELRRPVAVKVLRRRLAGEPILVARFRDESLIAAQLQHPGIVPVYAIGQLGDGRPYCTMKLVRGETFSDVLKRRPTPLADLIPTLAIFRRVCEALGYAHGKRIIHRDLKPGNVMVGAHDEVLLVDWGLAKKLRDQNTLDNSTGLHSPTVIVDVRTGDLETRSGLGSLPYLAPEQATARMNEIDERSDVFGLGAILCVILTGKPPYVGSAQVSIEHKALTGDLEEAYARLDRCGADQELIELAMRCLSRDRSVRPQNASAVTDLIAGYLSGVEERLRRAELQSVRLEAEAREQRKRRRVQMAFGVCLFLLFAVAGFGMWFTDSKNRERRAEQRIELNNHRQAAMIALGEAEVALRKENPIYGEIDAPLVQALKRIDAGGLDELREHYDRLAKDFKMIRRLDEIDNRRWMWSTTSRKVDLMFAMTNYPAAFSEYEIDLVVQSPGLLAERVRLSRISSRLMAGLHNWLELGVNQKLVEVLNSLDPEPLHQELRRAYDSKSASEVARLTARINADAIPPFFAQFVGGHPLTPKADAARILSAAQTKYPDHFGVAVQMALYWHHREPKRLEERIGAFRIALAIRPGNDAVRASIAHAYYSNRDYDAAIRAFREVIRSDPKLPEPYNDLGLVLTDKGEFGEAIRVYKEALLLAPGDATLHYNFGRALQFNHDLVGAIAAYHQSIKLDPKNARVWSNLGAAFHATGDYDGTIQACREAIKLDINFAPAYNNLGLALAGKHDLDEAIKAHQEAVRLDPKDSLSRFNLGVALHHKGNISAAVKAYREAIGLGHNLARVWSNLGAALHGLNDFDGAIHACHEAIKHDPTFAQGYDTLGLALVGKNDIDSAIKAHQKAIRYAPSDSLSHFHLGVALHHKGDINEAIKKYRESIRLGQNSALVWSNLGTALHSSGELDEAIQACRKAIKIDPNYAPAYTNLGLVLVDKQDVQGAIKAHKDAIRLDPTDAIARFNLGVAYGNDGSVDHSIQAYRDAIKLDPKYATAYSNLGAALRDKGDPDGAIAAYREAVRLKHSWAPTYNNLAELLAERKEPFTALQVLRDGLLVDPRFIDDFRYNLACFACLGASGQSKDTPPKVDPPGLRHMALDWLVAELALQRKRSGDAGGKSTIHAMMLHWLTDPDLATVRDIEKIPAKEREGWAKFWASVRQLRDDTAPEVAPPPRLVK